MSCIKQRIAVPMLAVLLISAGCSDGADTELPEQAAPVAEGWTTSSVPETTTVTEATTTSEPTTFTPPAQYSCKQFGAEVRQCKHIDYLTDSVGTWQMTAYLPIEGVGPWPLVVVYHGMGTQAADTQARTVAQNGAVALAPLWIGADINDISPEDYIDGYLFDRAACATGMAQAIAPDLGADPSNTTVVGFSAGVHPAGWIGLGVVRDQSACPEPIRHQPAGMVLGDSQMIFQHDRWDDAFEDRQSSAADTLDRLTNPRRWNVPDGFLAYLWTTETTAESRPVDPEDAWSWLRLRDRDGLVRDLDALGCLDDEVVGFIDTAVLLEYRMRGLGQAGVLAVAEEFSGDHSYKSEVYPRIAEVLAGEFEPASRRAFGDCSPQL